MKENVKVMVRVGKQWVVYAVVPQKFVDLYAKYAISRGYREVTVATV